MKKPLVIAHRGASGYRPENTLEAFQLGLAQGADGIEFDLVTTKDEELIIRHENALSGTTDVATQSVFSARKRIGLVDDAQRFDWYSEDFELAEIKALRAKERLPESRSGSAKFDGQFEIPTLNELLAQDFLRDKVVVCEIKEGSHLAKLSPSIEELLAQKIELSKPISNLIIESFSLEILLSCRGTLEAKGIQAKYFYLLEHDKSEEITKHLGQLDGISISLDMLFGEFDWVGFAHKNGKQIWAYTARAEEADTSIEAYYEKIIQTGVDGIFADQPDLLRRVLEDRAG